MSKYAEYEEKLKHIQKLQKLIAFPEENRLLKEHRKLEGELQKILSDPKMTLFMTFKKIKEEDVGRNIDHPDYQYTFHKKSNGEIVLHKGSYSLAGHPEMYYFEENGKLSFRITTSIDSIVEDLTAEEALNELLSGRGFIKK